MELHSRHGYMIPRLRQCNISKRRPRMTFLALLAIPFRSLSRTRYFRETYLQFMCVVVSVFLSGMAVRARECLKIFSTWRALPVLMSQ